MNMREMLETTVAKHPDKIALIYGDIQWKYKQFLKRTYSFGNALKELSFYHGDRIAVLMKNRPEYFEVYFGASGIGGIVVPLNTRLGIREIVYILKHSGANTLVYEEDYCETVEQIKQQVKGIKNYIVIGEVAKEDYKYTAIIEDASSHPPKSKASDDDIAFICYTSGTTGNPKGAMITHRNITSMCSNQLVDLPKSSEDIGMVLFPFFHIGVVMGFHKIAIGMTCVFCDFNPSEVARLIQTYGITDIDIPATPLRLFTQAPEIHRYDLSSLRVITTGGGFSTPDTFSRLFELFDRDHDIKVANVYGMTENTAHVMSNIVTPKNLQQEIGEMESLSGVKAAGLGAGRPIYGIQTKIVDENMRTMPINSVGEIAVKGDTVMKGYWQESDKTSEVITEDGWYLTGDLGIQLENGEYFIIDRKNYKIVTGDENVYPGEVERVLQQHPSIKEVSVFGVPDQKWLEIVKAVVVLKSEANVSEQELKEFCKGRIANYKVPKEIVFADKIPVNASGKVLKHLLKEMYA